MTPDPEAPKYPESRWRLAYLAAALTSAVPFAYGLGAGGSFYFRDISSFFFPLHRFIVEGLRHGEIRQWNPYFNEGVPVLAISYPFDLLQALVPNVWGFSFFLALHVPMAAVCFLGLARRLGLGPAPAVLGALVYALSGFSLSSLNLYTHLQALAWAPVVIATLIAASRGAGREIATAALAMAVCISTMGIEIAIQAVIIGWVLSASRRLGGLLRLAGSTLLGIGLAAAPLAALIDRVSGSHRERGFSMGAALDQSVHPVSFLQTLIAGLFGDPMSFGTAYWGHTYWNDGTPFYLSLYLGAAVLCLVAVGAMAPSRHRAPLVLLLVAGTVICLGSWARLDLLLEMVPPLRKFRFPVKAFFTILLASSLLASSAAHRLATASRGWRALAVAAGLLGLGLVSLPLIEPLVPAVFAGIERSFFPLAHPWALRAPALRGIFTDAATGGLAALAMAGVAGLRLRERLSAPGAVAAIAAILAADLLRAGAGLNPTVHFDWYELSPEMSREVVRMREAGGRAFTCAVLAAPAYRQAFEQRKGRLGAWAYGVQREALTPYANLDARMPSVGRDPTDLVPSERTLSVEEEMCRAKGALSKLREMGVRHLLAVQPMISDGLRLVGAVSPARTAPLSIYVHEVEDSLPDPSVAPSPDDLDGRGMVSTVPGAQARYVLDSPEELRVAVSTPRVAYLVVRRAQAPGWSASVDGGPAEVVLANGRHQAVRVPSGASQVELRYRAPHARLGVVLSALCAMLAAILWITRRKAGEGPTGSVRGA